MLTSPCVQSVSSVVLTPRFSVLTLDAGMGMMPMGMGMGGFGGGFGGGGMQGGMMGGGFGGGGP